MFELCIFAVHLLRYSNRNMLFNSFDFAIFLPLVFVLYWGIFNRKNATLRNGFLVVASYVFYGFWDWRFLSLIIISSLTDFWNGGRLTAIDQCSDISNVSTQRKKRNWLLVSIITNLGLLGFFKYFGFFAESFAAMMSVFGIVVSPMTLNIILPVGISFYTFQTLSYTIDIYRGKTEATKSWVQFFAFVSFFPQLMAGPIERATNFLPQFADLAKKPDYSVFRNAMLLVAWGFFKKIMIADRLAVLVDGAFKNSAAADGLPMLLGIIFFAFQLYLDFSAYSDIAIGVARMFGFELRRNFKRPYLSASFDEFWKRWHISLSSWFRDYVYIPLGGNRRGTRRTVINVLIVFAVSGLWHGASWNFVIWGLLNALFMILLDPILNSKTLNGGIVTRFVKSGFIFACWALSLAFFRAQGLDAALECFRHIGFVNTDSIINFGLNTRELTLSFILLGILTIKGLVWEKSETAVSAFFFKLPAVLRWVFYIVFVLSIIYFGHYGNGNEHSFIYFQF